MYCEKIIEDAMNEMYIFDSETLKFVYCNNASLSNLGYTVEEMKDLTPIDLKIEYTTTEFEIEILQPLREGLPYIEFTAKHKRKDGTLYDVNVKLQLINEPDGSVFAAIIDDITDKISYRKELEQHRNHLEELVSIRTDELNETMEMYKTLAKASPVGLFRTDKEGRGEYVNAKWREIAGMDAEEALGDGWLAAIHADDREMVVKEWTRCLKEGIDFSLEFRFRTIDGIVTWVLGQANRINGGGKGYVGTITDITHKKEALPMLMEIRDLPKCSRGL